MTIPEKLTVFLASMDPDKSKDIVLASHLEVNSTDEDQPLHQHHKGQFLFVLNGSMTCETLDKVWLIPHHCAVWIPGNVLHRVKSRGGAVAYYLFIEPGQCCMPDMCKMYSISPLVREMLISLVVDDAMLYEKNIYQSVAEILLRLLPESPVISLQIQTSLHPVIRAITDKLSLDPGNRMTMAEWAELFSISERSLARLVIKETRLSFGRWRQQFQLFAALHLLQSGSTVHAVAVRLGYHSTTAFITMFRKALGHSPMHYLSSLSR